MAFVIEKYLCSYIMKCALFQSIDSCELCPSAFLKSTNGSQIALLRLNNGSLLALFFFFYFFYFFVFWIGKRW